MDVKLKIYWLPESLKHPAYYAPADYEKDVNTVTSDAYAAMRFNNKEDCERWCNDNPIPAFGPVEHGFYEEEKKK